MNDSNQQTKETKKRRFYKSSKDSSKKVQQKKTGKPLILKKDQKTFNYKNYFGVFKKIQIEHFIIFFLFVNLCLIAFISFTISAINVNKLSKISVGDVKINPYPYLKIDPRLNITAKSAIVFEKDSRVVVFRKNANLHFTPASTTKIMTAVVALENYSLDSVLKANGVNKVEGSKMKLIEGERMKVGDLLYGMLLPSGNDAAYVLAENFSGGVSAFVNKMNEKARELRLFNTKFVDPSGYDDGNYTTAFDLARLASYALNNKTFSKIVDTKSRIVYDSSYKISHKLDNLNELLGEDGVTGVKTGFTDEAGGVLVTSFNYKNELPQSNLSRYPQESSSAHSSPKQALGYSTQNKTYIIVVLKSEDRFSDTQEIISKVVKNIELFSYR